MNKTTPATLLALLTLAVAGCSTSSESNSAPSSAQGTVGSSRSSAQPGSAAPSTSTGVSSSSTPSSGSSAPGTSANASPSSGPSDSSTAAAPATAGSSTYTAPVWGHFVSPSGRLSCDVSNDVAGCYLPPALQAAHGGNNLVLLGKDGWKITSGNLASNDDGSGTVWTHDGSGPRPTQTNGQSVLAYGSTLRVGSNACHSNSSGITCSNGVSSFTLNVRNVTGIGPKAPSN